MSSCVKRRLLISLAIFACVTIILGSLAGEGIGLYFLYQSALTRPSFTVGANTTTIYASPSNYDNTFYDYPFTADSVYRILEETDGYLVPLLQRNDTYLMQDCPGYHDDEKCPGHLLTYYQNITFSPDELSVHTNWVPMTPTYQNQTIFSCSTEQLRNGVKLSRFLVGFFGALILLADVYVFVSLVSQMPKFIRRIQRGYPDIQQEQLVESPKNEYHCL